jgi:hypothetical protein
MRSLRHGLRHEEMIERIATIKRKSNKSGKMRFRDIQPIESLLRQDHKNLFYICIKLADPQPHGDFPKGDNTDEDIVHRIADKATRMVPSFSSSFSRHNKACVSRSSLVFHRGQDVCRQAVEVFGNFDLPAQRARLANNNVL